MKKIIILLFALAPVMVFAQKSGRIVYKETVKMDIELPDDIPEEIKKQIPKERVVEKELIFNEKNTLYKNVEKDEDEEEEIESGNRRMRFRMMAMAADDKLFTDLETGVTVEKKDFMEKTFLIDGEQKKRAWKIAPQQAKVNGYVCQRATFEDEESSIEAWFSPQIPVSSGPGYAGLPGVILKMEITPKEMKEKPEAKGKGKGEREGKKEGGKDGKEVNKEQRGGQGQGQGHRRGRRATTSKIIIVAQTIELGKVAKKELKAPEKGKKVTEEEYREIVREKMKEMREMNGGGPRMIIRH